MAEPSKIPQAMIRPADVLLGRGRSMQNYGGNVAFRAVVKTRCHEYLGQNCIERDVTCHDIIQLIHSRDGRFLEKAKNGSEDCWVCCSYPTIRLKVRQALRDSLKVAGSARGNHCGIAVNSSEFGNGSQQTVFSSHRDRRVVHEFGVPEVETEQLESYLRGGIQDPRPAVRDLSSNEKSKRSNICPSDGGLRRRTKEATTLVGDNEQQSHRVEAGLNPEANESRSDLDMAAASSLFEIQGERNCSLSKEPSVPNLRSFSSDTRSDIIVEARPDKPRMAYALGLYGRTSAQSLSSVPSAQMPMRWQPPALLGQLTAPSPQAVTLQDDPYLTYLLMKRKALKNALAVFEPLGESDRMGQN